MAEGNLEKRIFDVDVFYANVEYLINLCAEEARVDRIIASLKRGDITPAAERALECYYSGSTATAHRERLHLQIDDGVKAIVRFARCNLKMEVAWEEISTFTEFAERSSAFRNYVGREVRKLRADNANRAKAHRCEPKLIGLNGLLGLYMLEKYKGGDKRHQHFHRHP